MVAISVGLVGSTIHRKGTKREVVCNRLRLGRAATKALEKFSRCSDVFLPAKIKIVQDV